MHTSSGNNATRHEASTPNPRRRKAGSIGAETRGTEKRQAAEERGRKAGGAEQDPEQHDAKPKTAALRASSPQPKASAARGPR